MSTDQNKQIVRDFYNAIAREDYEAAARCCHEDFVFYLQVDEPIHGVDGFIASEKKNFDSFSPFEFSIQQLLAEGDQVAAYMLFDGLHTGNANGIEPTGNRVRFSLAMWLTIEDGKIRTKRAHFDSADVHRQLDNAY